MSKYDSIKTAADLVAEVQLHGLSTAQEDICRAQDIFGDSPIKELIRLANDIGRDNSKGEPDPKGTWGGGRKGTQGTFYMILHLELGGCDSVLEPAHEPGARGAVEAEGFLQDSGAGSFAEGRGGRQGAWAAVCG